MIHIMLPTQYSSRADARLAEPQKRLMAAVLQTVVDDCRGGRYAAIDMRRVRTAIAYVSSTDRTWPFSFENLCEALGLDAGGLRAELQVTRVLA